MKGQKTDIYTNPKAGGKTNHVASPKAKKGKNPFAKAGAAVSLKGKNPQDKSPKQ